jgi:hypothetical protein
VALRVTAGEAAVPERRVDQLLDDRRAFALGPVVLGVDVPDRT